MTYDFAPFTVADAESAAVDPGLRDFLGRVYAKTAAGLAVSAVVAAAVGYWAPLRHLIFVYSPAGDLGLTLPGAILLISPLIVLLAAAFVMRRRGGRAAATLFWTVVTLTGGSLSVLAITYTGGTLISTFLVTAAAFGALSLLGYVTKRNLTGLGNFLTVALSGLVLAMLVNLFVANATVYLMLNILGVLIFAGLIAADTQRLKLIYYDDPSPDRLAVSTSFGALTLYLNFINLFELLLSFSGRGGRRR